MAWGHEKMDVDTLIESIEFKCKILRYDLHLKQIPDYEYVIKQGELVNQIIQFANSAFYFGMVSIEDRNRIINTVLPDEELNDE